MADNLEGIRYNRQTFFEGRDWRRIDHLFEEAIMVKMEFSIGGQRK